MAYSWITHSAIGGQQNFVFSFPYLSRAHVHVYRIDGSSNTPFEYFDWTWLNASTVRLNGAAYEGESIRVQRITPIAQPIIDFVNGSVLVENDLDASTQQVLYALQERLDAETETVRLTQAGVWDFLGYPATGLGLTETISVMPVQHLGIDRTHRAQLNFENTDSITFSVVDDPVNARTEISATANVADVDVFKDLTQNNIEDSISEFTIATVSIDAGVMDQESHLTVESLVSYMNNSGADRSVTLSLYVGGVLVGSGQHTFAAAGTNLHHLRLRASIQNLSSLTSQFGFVSVERSNGAQQVGGVEPAGLLSIDTEASFDVVLKGQMATNNSTQILVHRSTVCEVK